MTLTRIIARTATIALAAAALAAPTALARPVDAPSALAKAQHEHSLPSSDADSAGSAHKQARMGAAREYPTRPAQGDQANPRHDTSLAAADHGIDETTIGLWVATGLLALALIASIVARLRSGRSRLTT